VGLRLDAGVRKQALRLDVARSQGRRPGCFC
jgi:hypothetical protein